MSRVGSAGCGAGWPLSTGPGREKRPIPLREWPRAGGICGVGRSRGASPLHLPRDKGGWMPRPQNGSREVLGQLHPLPELSSSSSSDPQPGSLPGPRPSSAHPKAAAWEQSPIPPLGDPHPAPTAPFWDGTRAGQPGCVWGRKRRVWEEERKGPSPPTAGRAGSWKTLCGFFFLQAVPISNTLSFLVRSHLQRCHNKTLECPSCPCGASPCSRPAELRRFSFFPIITIIINSNAGCN